MKRSIFISRHLAEDSHLLAYLTEHNWEVYHRSLIRIEPIPFHMENEYDWIFLSSSNGAKLLLENWQPPQGTRIGVVGEATAATVRSFDYEPAFVGASGNMHEVGTHFVPVLGNKSVLFCGAEGGSEKLRSELPQHQVHFLPIYRTVSETEANIPTTEVVFLTSPSNARGYLNCATLEGKTTIAIGHTTAEFLHQQGVENVLIPSAPTEEHVVALLRKL